MTSLPKSFKAISVSKPDGPWEIITVPMRDPAPNEILIRVHSSGVCYSDVFVKKGYWPGLQYPRTPGHEVVGRIARLGSGIKEGGRFTVGALVGAGWNGGYCTKCDFCRKGQTWACVETTCTGISFDGGHAEYMYAPETSLVSISEEALQKSSYAEISPLLCAGVTVYDAIRSTKWNPGDLCIVQGVGGLGHLAIQYAAKLGLNVYAVSSGSSKRELALSLGASGYIDSKATDAVAEIQRLGGANIIVSTVPAADEISNIIPAIGKNGTVTIVAVPLDKPIKMSTITLNMNRASVRGWLCGDSSHAEKCVEFSTLKDVKPKVNEFTLADFDKAWDGLMDHSAKFRNVIVFP